MLHDSSYDRSERSTRNSNKDDAAYANGMCHIMGSNNALCQRITGQIIRILMLFIDLLGKTFAAHPETHHMAISRDDVGNHRTETTSANDCHHCRYGQYQEKQGSTSCKDCAKGRFTSSASANLTTCDFCTPAAAVAK